jgi:hypothetical protein
MEALFGIFILLLIPSILIYLAYKARRGRKGEFYIGKYIMGLPDVYKPKDGIKGVIQDNNLIIRASKELAKIPLANITSVETAREAGLSSKTFKNTAVLGTLGAILSTDGYYLNITWVDERGQEYTTVFENTFRNASTTMNRAASEIKQRLQSDSKKCKHCAELIKREARICKYCQQPV